MRYLEEGHWPDSTENPARTRSLIKENYISLKIKVIIVGTQTSCHKN